MAGRLVFKSEVHEENHVLRHVNRILSEINRKYGGYYKILRELLRRELQETFNGWISTNKAFIESLSNTKSIFEIYEKYCRRIEDEIMTKINLCDTCRKYFRKLSLREVGFFSEIRWFKHRLERFINAQPDYVEDLRNYRYDYPLLKSDRRFINRLYYKHNFESSSPELEVEDLVYYLSAVLKHHRITGWSAESGGFCKHIEFEKIEEEVVFPRWI